MDMDRNYILKERNGKIGIKLPELTGLEYVIDKYDGSMNTRIEEDILMLNIIFPMGKESEQEKK